MKKNQSSLDILHNKTLKDHLFIFFSLLLAIIFFYPVIFSDNTFFFRDIHRWFHPMKYFLASSIKAGSIPYWNLYNYCGAPFMSDIQSGLFYPLSLPFFLLPYPLSFNIYIVLHLFLGFVFFYLFIKGLGLSKKTALITAISYCYGGYTIASVNTLNNLTSVIWLPAILWSYQKGRENNNKSWYCLTIFFLCMSILGGEPQIFILSASLLFFYSLFISSRQGPSPEGYFKAPLIVLLLFLSALLITSVQLGMTYMDYNVSARLGGISYEEASRFSLNVNMLKHLILPLRFDAGLVSGPDPLSAFYPGHREIPWLLTIYPGMLIVPLALIGILFNFSRGTLLWLLIFLVTLVLAMGNATPLHFIFYKILPVFRFPVKFMFLTGFSLLIMSAYGFDRVFELLRQKGERSLIIFCLLLSVMVLDLYSAHKDINPICRSDFYEYYHPSLQPVMDDPGIFRIYSDTDIITPPNLKSTIMDNHIQWQMMLNPDLGIFNDISHLGGLPALELRYQYLITEILLKPWAERVRFLRLANVKYIVTTHGIDRDPVVRQQVERVSPLVYKIKDNLPRAWIVGKLDHIKKGTIEELTSVSFDPATSAITKGDIVNKYNDSYFREVSKIRYEKNSQIQIELETDKPGILVLSESSYPGWRVFIDGKERKCLWLNLLFQGVEIEAGQHQVDFIYRPKNFFIFLTISIVSLTALFLIWLYYLCFGKKRIIL